MLESNFCEKCPYQSRLMHLLKSNFIKSFDEVDWKSKQHKRDIKEADKITGYEKPKKKKYVALDDVLEILRMPRKLELVNTNRKVDMPAIMEMESKHYFDMQAALFNLETKEIEVVESLEETERGNNGFGSTGK